MIVGRLLIAFALAVPELIADSAYETAEAKLDSIANNQVKPGETVLFTPQEINAWARTEVPGVVPQGIRDERVAAVAH